MAEQTAIEEAEEVFEAPERGSAEELLDARAGDPLDPMRHSAAHVVAEPVMGYAAATDLVRLHGRPQAIVREVVASCSGGI